MSAGITGEVVTPPPRPAHANRVANTHGWLSPWLWIGPAVVVPPNGQVRDSVLGNATGDP